MWKARNAPLVNNDDPWGWGRSLEWATSSPPPRHNFTSIPRIRSESPAFDLHHPEVALSEYEGTSGQMFEDSMVDSPDDTGRVEELKARVEGTTDDAAAHHEVNNPSRSPRQEEGQ